MNERKNLGPRAPRVKMDVPWNEKTSPGPVPGPVKLTVPWDEAAAKLIPTPGLPKRGKK